MSPQAQTEVAARIEKANAAQTKTRAVESLERALWRWSSERKIDGADSALRNSVETFLKAFGGES